MSEKTHNRNLLRIATAAGFVGSLALGLSGVNVIKGWSEKATSKVEKEVSTGVLDYHLTHAYSEVTAKDVKLGEPKELAPGRTADVVNVSMEAIKNKDIQESPGIPYAYEGIYVQMQGANGSTGLGDTRFIRHSETDQTAVIRLNRDLLKKRGDSEIARLFLVTRGVSESTDPAEARFIQDRIGLTYVESVQITGENGIVTSAVGVDENIPNQVVQQKHLIYGSLVPAPTPIEVP